MRVTHAGLHLCRTGTFKMQDVFDMVYSLLVFVNIRVILYKTYVVLICGKYNTLTLEFKINIAIRVPLHTAPPTRSTPPLREILDPPLSWSIFVSKNTRKGKKVRLQKGT